MMNYVAIQITSYCVALWEFPVGSNTVGVIHQQTKYGWFPEIFGQEYGLNVILVMTLTVGMYIYLKYSKHGYEITVVGDSENTARYAGISVKKVTVRTMAISGAICGLAGFIAVAGVGHTMCDDSDFFAAGLSAKGRYSDCHSVRSERLCLQHHHWHHLVLHSGQ